MNKEKIWKVGTLEYTTIGLIIMSLWLIGGDIPLQLKGRAVLPSATIIIKEIGVSEFLYGIIVYSWPQFTSIFLGPIVCYISDRHRGRWGRRIPFLFWTMPFIVVGICGLGFSQTLGEYLSINFHWNLETAQLFSFFMAWALLDFGTSVGGFLFGALVNDVMPREVLGRFFSIFRIISLLIGIIFNKFIIEFVKEYPIYVFCGVGIFYGIGIILLCLKIKEGEYPPPPEEEMTNLAYNNVITRKSIWDRVIIPTKTYFSQCFSMSYYRWFAVIMTLEVLCTLPINLFTIQYCNYLGLSNKEYGSYTAITYAISLIISFPIGMIADKYHPLRSIRVILFVYAITMITAWIFISKNNFGVFLILHGVISGMYFTANASMGAKLLPRVLYAQFTSAASLIISITMVIFAPLLGVIVDLISYRHMFLLAFIFSINGIWILGIMLKKYKQYGGDENYQAPLPSNINNC